MEEEQAIAAKAKIDKIDKPENSKYFLKLVFLNFLSNKFDIVTTLVSSYNLISNLKINDVFDLKIKNNYFKLFIIIVITNHIGWICFWKVFKDFETLIKKIMSQINATLMNS
ncbi:hypothetical protein CJJ23_01825 [Mycoplasmopsis agassizii]|uniref:Uncharacterized protein n=1 Tax=Mycoplasmopsis agassizii TaxID=33922 RepID=A0A269TJ65_9BACT|nr:hypothetical protein CJJ23_01825 [Mycoplasmopsis agassizii]